MEVEKEIWRDISGYPGYQVSNLGRVKSLERKVKHMNSYRTVKEKILNTRKFKNGYLVINLHNKGKRKTMTVHRLVCEAFIPNPNNLQYVNHKDECKTNNNVENLEWCTIEYNCNFGSRNERISKTNTNGKKSKAVICIETGKIYPSAREIQRQLGFNQGNISKCCIGEKKSAYKFHWKYVE